MEQKELLWKKLLSVILHDLRSPFQGLNGCVSILQEDWDDLTEEERKDLVEKISLSSRTVIALLNEFSEWGEELSGEADPKAINLPTTIEETLRHLQSEAEQKGVKIKASLFDAEHPFVFYKGILSFAIRNIVANAIRFTNAGGAVDVCITKSNGHTRISIFDSGIGMSEERRKNLFSPVGSLAGTDGQKGKGIGLTLVKFFLEECGASISAESTEGKGTSFFLDFPKYQAT